MANNNTKKSNIALENSNSLENTMNVSDSFVHYLKTMREYYDSGLHLTDPLPTNFTFDEIEIDANTYGFNTKNLASSVTDDRINEIINNCENKQKSPTPAPAPAQKITNTKTQQTISPTVEYSQKKDVSKKFPSNQKPSPTEVTTIELFEKNDRVLNVSNKSPSPKSTLTLTKRISTFFLRYSNKK